MAWKTPDSSRFTSLWRPSPDSVEMVISVFSRIVLPLASSASPPSSLLEEVRHLAHLHVGVGPELLVLLASR
jgi:hypothetical protein